MIPYFNPDVPDTINPLNWPKIHRRYASDYERMRMRGNDSIFRLSFANAQYNVVKSYPSSFLVPASVGDETFPKILKGFRNGRFPVITWTSENGALLIRGSGLTSSNMVQKFKKQANILHPTESGSTLGGSRLTLTSKESGESIPVNSTEYQVLRGDKNVEFVPISFPNTHQMKVSFKKLLRVMRPSWPHVDVSTSSFSKSLEDSEWMLIIALCIEEGWDATCQLMALSQLLIDPYYRTIDGFRV
uniref:Myotubularin phosphatase domain-containing protein n=1 Tax=Heterorhabditis bacteriophora TaxID=37862 RepID=A0A1I7WH33_HETBA